jgi:hypothetical protein
MTTAAAIHPLLPSLEDPVTASKKIVKKSKTNYVPALVGVMTAN